jgi:ATP/maltotriose-dependent transcriptional regulator MalT
LYCQGEAHRLRGEFDAAEEAYRQASLHGYEPQPGLALMRLTQGKTDAAAAAIRRFAGETTAPLRRAGILPAYVEIMLASGSLDLARAACRELDDIAQQFDCEALNAMAAHARAATTLAEGRAGDALIHLRRALAIWTDLDAPYELARVRSMVGLACRAMDDRDTAALEMEAARRTFTELGAVSDEARVASLVEVIASGNDAADTHGLTARELEVLRLLAAGKSNREIGEALFISEHTVARHVQNIFAKLDVSSRAAATAFAFSHQLV